MASSAAIKFDDGTGAFVNNCFPVRSIVRYGEQGEGAWLEAHRAEQRKRFKAVVCSKPPRTYSRLKHERIEAERIIDDESPELEESEVAGTVLDGFFLMKHCCVEDPADLCSINISGLGIEDTKPDDFQLFDNVAYVNAADNRLDLDGFNRFSILRELELPVNGISNLGLTHKMFPNLEMLDLSYNNLNKDDLLQLGYLRNLKVLYLSGNDFQSLPENLAGFYITKSGFKKRRFPKLEILCLDDNHLNNYTAFAPLAGLKELKHLNLEKNEISAVPQLEPKTIKHDTIQEEEEESDAAPQKQTEQTEDSGKEQTTVNPVDEPTPDFTFAQLEVPDLGKLDITRLEGGEAVLDGDGEMLTDSEDEMDEDEAPAIPFPQLRFLTLAHNYLTEEEDLLPIAAWPNLTQVHIYDNPLTNERSGDPPMLKKFLTDRLGIDLIRKKPVIVLPSREFAPPRKERQVSSLIPPVPRCDVEKLLSLESMKHIQAPPPQFSSATADAKSPLPPITKSSPPPAESKRELKRKASIRILQEESEGEDKEREEPVGAQPEGDGQAFFMTQIDDLTAAGQQSTFCQSNKTIESHQKKAPVRKMKQISPEQEKMFRGYEELLIEDDMEKQIQVPSNLQNAVKALHYALKHPVVNNHTMRLDTSQKPFLPYKRSDVGSRKRPETRAEKISRAMEGVRAMHTVIESPLGNALADKELIKSYPEAAKLLRDIQRKYAKVHSSAMGESEALRSAVQRLSGKERPHTDMVYMADKDTSMTDIIRPTTNL